MSQLWKIILHHIISHTLHGTKYLEYICRLIGITQSSIGFEILSTHMKFYLHLTHADTLNF